METGWGWYDRPTDGGPDDGGQDEIPECPHCGGDMEEFHICPDSDTSEPLGDLMETDEKFITA
jgi:hypothetical protein